MKSYVKPDLFYESFELSENIAACAWDMTSQTPETCAAIGDTDFGIGDYAIFTAGVTGCVITDYQGYCYQPGASNSNIFNS